MNELDENNLSQPVCHIVFNVCVVGVAFVVGYFELLFVTKDVTIFVGVCIATVRIKVASCRHRKRCLIDKFRAEWLLGVLVDFIYW